MKVGVLTLPLHVNYGGILQAFALISVLKKFGHDAWLINLNRRNKSIVERQLVVTKRKLFEDIFFKKTPDFDGCVQHGQSHELDLFVIKFIKPQTKTIKSSNDFRKLIHYKFEAYIVGSDQVWREEYCREFKTNLFLDFVSDNTKKISYAASFGVNAWEYNSKNTEILSSLAQKFDVISVREDSAVTLCIENLHVKAEQHVDPTLLLDVVDYYKLIDGGIGFKSTELYAYILDDSEYKKRIISKISNYLSLDVISFYSTGPNSCSIMQNNILPSISNFLEGFIKAKFIVTDSYHGCVFSILFNKPFIAIGNLGRGLDRFVSLLKMMGLENRLILTLEELSNNNITNSINWELVNIIISNKRKEGSLFLKNSLV